MPTPFYPSGRPLVSCARAGVFCTRPSTGKNIAPAGRCPGSVEFEPDQREQAAVHESRFDPFARARLLLDSLLLLPPRSPLRSRLPAQRSSRHFPEGKSLLPVLGRCDFVRDLRARAIWGGGGLDLEVGSSARLSRAG
jgi:hypothetical protein